jgi:hypothetical protein
MGNESNPKKLTGTATTTIGSCSCFGISVNKTLTGTLTVNESGTAVGQFAVGTIPGTYFAIPNGVRYAALTLVLSAGDDVTVFTKAI